MKNRILYFIIGLLIIVTSVLIWENYINKNVWQQSIIITGNGIELKQKVDRLNYDYLNKGWKIVNIVNLNSSVAQDFFSYPNLTYLLESKKTYYSIIIVIERI